MRLTWVVLLSVVSAVLLWVVPWTRLDLVTGAAAVACLAGVTVGLSALWAWFAPRRGPWPWRRPAMIAGLGVLVFASGTAAVGIAVRAEAAELQSKTNVKQLGLGIVNYTTTRKDRLPQGVVRDANGVALHGWQTTLLPYLEQEKLYEQINHRVPWDDPCNAPHFRTIVPGYLYPGVTEQRDGSGYALTHYAGNVHVLADGRNFLGASSVILAGEVWADFRPWGEPGNCRDPAQGLYTTPDSFGSPVTRKGANFVMAHGGVTFITKDVDAEVLDALAKPR